MSVAAESQPLPRVSVLMTIYNAAPFLASALDSVIAQSFTDWELVVVENGSTDGSAGILANYSDVRIRAFPLKANIGRTPALRHAFERARGEYIAVLDADDVAYPQRLHKQVSYLDTHPEVVLLGTWTDHIDEQDKLVGRWTPPVDSVALLTLLGSANPVVHSSAMYRSSIAREVGGYPLDFPHSQDLGLWLRLLERGTLAMLGEPLCKFRIATQNMTRLPQHRVDVARDYLRLLLMIRERVTLGKEGRRSNREELAIARMRHAVSLARTGHVISGAWAACRALCADPVGLMNNRITRGFFSK